MNRKIIHNLQAIITLCMAYTKTYRPNIEATFYKPSINECNYHKFILGS